MPRAAALAMLARSGATARGTSPGVGVRSVPGADSRRLRSDRRRGALTDRRRRLVAAGRARVRVPAKVNLQLSVGPPRADGYHDVATVYQAVSLFDEVTVEPADRLEVVVAGDEVEGVPADASN